MEEVNQIDEQGLKQGFHRFKRMLEGEERGKLVFSVEGEGHYINGKREGYFLEYYRFPTILHSVSKWKNGMITGLYRTWYVNGDLFTKANFSKNAKKCIYKKMHKNKNVECEYEFITRIDRERQKVHPLPNGLHSSWYLSGEIDSKTNFIIGEKEGEEMQFIYNKKL